MYEARSEHEGGEERTFLLLTLAAPQAGRVKASKPRMYLADPVDLLCDLQQGVVIEADFGRVGGQLEGNASA